MFKWILGVMIAVLVSMPAHADLPSLDVVRVAGNQLVPGGQKAQIGTRMADYTRHVLKASYSTARDGSTINTTVAMKGVDGKAAVLPAGAIVTGVILDVLKPVSGTGSLSIYAESTKDILNTRPATSLTAGLYAGIASSVVAFKTTAARNVSVVITGDHLLTGKFNALIEYYLSDTQ